MNCNKKSFTSKPNAKRYAKIIGTRLRINYYAYKCKTCGNFHVARNKNDLMPIEKIHDILSEYNMWRTDNAVQSSLKMPKPSDITQAISHVLAYIDKH